jgi:hypothetical protein
MLCLEKFGTGRNLLFHLDNLKLIGCFGIGAGVHHRSAEEIGLALEIVPTMSLPSLREEMTFSS